MKKARPSASTLFNARNVELLGLYPIIKVNGELSTLSLSRCDVLQGSVLCSFLY